MSTGNLGRLLSVVAALFVAGVASAQGAVHISEIHYDNAGTDTGEALEISAPAGTDLTGWQVVLYNATNGVPTACPRAIRWSPANGGRTTIPANR